MKADEIDKTIMDAKLFLNQHRPPKKETPDSVIAKARKFLAENKAGPDREVWIGLGGKKVFFPSGTHEEYRPGQDNYMSIWGLKWNPKW